MLLVRGEHLIFEKEQEEMLERYFEASSLFRCRVKALIVVDGSIGYGTGGFDLGHVLDALATDPWSHVEFNVTKAHRQNSADADVTDNFRFDAHDLSQYSQIWMFGIHDTTNALSASELKAVAQFMDGGGGVFATGDHNDLGQAMCAEVPRVRSMRRWHWPNPGPNGEPIAPSQTGPERHDTVMPGSGGGGGSQSDDVPQPIRPRWYSRTSGGSIVYQVQKFPHPVLCGPDGVIDYLPDHMHEGVCEVPANLSESFTFDGYTTAEYPTQSGHQERPQVIAWATDRNSGGAEFGVVGAYDGHRVGVGRVVVDATWHHWFNINLDGFVDASNPAHPDYDASVVPKWKAIQAYFRNVGAWLARSSIQSCLRNGGWILVAHAYEVMVTRQSFHHYTERLGYFWHLGTNARDALGRIASQCQTTRWIVDLVIEEYWPIDPWWTRGPGLPDPPPWLNVEDLEHVMLGGAIHALSEEYGNVKEPLKLIECDDGKILEVARKGAMQGVAELVQRFEKCGSEAKQLLGKHGQAAMAP